MLPLWRTHPEGQASSPATDDLTSFWLVPDQNFLLAHQAWCRSDLAHPMAPADSILHLFQLHPFLLPLTDTRLLILDPANQILTISLGVDHLSLEMSIVNLMGWHQINSAYLCEQPRVLKRKLNSTCLGSLYVQNYLVWNGVCIAGWDCPLATRQLVSGAFSLCLYHWHHLSQ